MGRKFIALMPLFCLFLLLLVQFPTISEEQIDPITSSQSEPGPGTPTRLEDEFEQWLLNPPIINNTQKDTYWNLSSKTQFGEGFMVNCDVGDGDLSLTPSQDHGMLDPTDPNILSMAVAEDGTVVCGMASGKIIAKNAFNGTTTFVQNNTQIYPGMRNITALAFDEYGRLWGACSDNGRLFYLDGDMGENFTDYGRLFALDKYISVLTYVGDHNKLWGGTGRLGYFFNIDVDTMANYTYNPFWLSKESVESMIYDDTNDILWAGTSLTHDQPPPAFPPPPRLVAINPSSEGVFNFSFEDWAMAEGGIAALTLDEDNNLYMGTQGVAKIIVYNIETQGVWISPPTNLAADAVTSLVFGSMSHNVYGTTAYPARIFTYNNGPKTFNFLLDGAPDGGNAFAKMVGNDEMVGMWISSYHNSHLLQMIPTGLWVSPFFNATEEVVWDHIDLETELPGGNSVVFGLLRHMDDLSDSNETNFEEQFVFVGSSDIDINDTQYMQIALILQTNMPFKNENSPKLFSYNLTFEYYPEMEFNFRCNRQEETVRNDILNYTVQLNNTGDGLVSRAKVKFDLPDGTAFITATHPYTIIGSTEVSFEIMNITRDSIETVNFELQVNDDIGEGSLIELKVDLNYSGIHDRYQPEQSSSVIELKVLEPHMSVEFSLDDKEGNPNQDIQGHILLNITDSQDITNVNVTLPMHSYTSIHQASFNWSSFKEGNNETFFWEFDIINKEAPLQIDIIIKVDPMANDNILFSLSTKATFQDGLGVNHYTESSPEIEVFISKPIMTMEFYSDNSNKDDVELGQTVPFVIQYSNIGHHIARNVTITVSFEDNVEDTTNPGATQMIFKIGDVPAQTRDIRQDFDLTVKTQEDNRSQVDVWTSLSYESSSDPELKTVDAGHVYLNIMRPDINIQVEQTDEMKGIMPGSSSILNFKYINSGDGYSQDLRVSIKSPDMIHIDAEDGPSETTLTWNTIMANSNGESDIALFAEEGLESGTNIVLDLTIQYSDAYGNSYRHHTQQYSLNVLTNPALLEPFKLTGMEPLDGAKDVSIDTECKFWFNTELDGRSLMEDSIKIEPVVQFSYHLEENGTVLRISFHSSLAHGTEYTITLSSMIYDSYGRGLEQEQQLTFTTEKKEEKETDSAQFTVPCCLVILLIIIAVIVLSVLIRRQKMMKEKLAQLSASEDEAEEPDIVYAPDRKIEPKVARAKPMARKGGRAKSRDIESAVAATPVGGDSLSLDISPTADDGPDMDAEPASMDDLESDLALGDPYSVDLGLLKTPGQGPGGKPVLALPPAVILDTKEPEVATPYSIDEIFVMTSEGILVQHFTAKGASAIDEDILAGMLTAVQMFIKDTFGGSTGDSALDELSLGDFKIMIGRGNFLSISVILSGEETDLVRPQLDSLVEDIETEFKDILEAWDGDMATVGGVQDNIKEFVEGKYID